MATFAKVPRFFLKPSHTEVDADNDDKHWVKFGTMKAERFAEDVSVFESTGDLKWISGGTGMVASSVKPVPGQPWRPVRTRLVNTGALVPDNELFVASTKKLGTTITLTPQQPSIIDSPETIKMFQDLVDKEKAHRRRVERRARKLVKALNVSSGGSASSPIIAPAASPVPSLPSIAIPSASPSALSSPLSRPRTGSVRTPLTRPNTASLGSPLSTRVSTPTRTVTTPKGSSTPKSSLWSPGRVSLPLSPS